MPERALTAAGVRMDSLAEFENHCPAGRRDWDSSSCVEDLLEEDEKDRAKRASRNKSEKKRREQFNVLIKELCTMLQSQGYPRKMDKSTILQRTIHFLEKQRELSAQTESCEIRQDWKPSFLSNEEFTQLMLEALDGFLIALTTDGNIIYVSDSVSSLTGHLPSDMVDQNILNFLPDGEHGDVYKLLSSHAHMTDPVSAHILENETHIEFCCHLARGNIDPKEPPTYDYVKFVGDFKFHNYVPTSSCNGFELAIPNLLQSTLEEQVCLVATVRLATPQFLKELCIVEEPCQEFTSRHSLEWKFLFLDHRASPIIGYLPFEVLGTSGYDYYHVDDLELIAECHKQLMQFGKGKSCYYRFLTKGQQWIWLQTHYYITYHQWNSKPEFIVCTHTVASYAEVRAEQRRELGMEEASSEMAPSSSIKSHEVYLDIRPEATQERVGRACSVSSHSSRKSSHTAMSDSASNSSIRYTEASTPSRQSIAVATNKALPRLQPNTSKALLQSPTSSNLHPTPNTPLSPPCGGLNPQPSTPLSPPCSQHSPMVQSAPLGVMHQLKEELEERTRVLQDDIKTQQQGLHHIKEQLQLLQMMLQKPQDVGPVPQAQALQAGPGRPQQGVSPSRQSVLGQEHLCSPLGSSPLPLSTTSAQVQRPVGSVQMQVSSLPVQTHTSIATPFYSNPPHFPSHCPPSQDLSQRHADFSTEGQLRMLLNQPIQSLLPDSTMTSHTSQCSTVLQPTNFSGCVRYTVEQQAMTTSLPQLSCSALIVPPFMISHNGFFSPQTQAPRAPQQPLQLQQQHYFQQMQAPGMQTQALFHTAQVPQQSTMGYIQPQQQQQQQQQPQQIRRTAQNQTGSLSSMQLPR
ncbi:neuronal PAS domain-containing protein 2-like isoform X1 [Conger conger]|uniref:neuronal PAS domain-containing protein 2-like isoform X1 n=1 Tax=Conger conger TaxID=82655 RepID=UPI002A5ADB1F|nr:neuronal PAS domain-containing protein 2-like isoform X1 [Conger conger]XP_061090209.1 neuronal PAS domain-containing protein 2-like isoform X1 [Conger conger]XP_061090210.1 neuronal PAS domain-containing protein 2-like isoform X1 [Conger conger]